MKHNVLGLMSGTSLDGLDLALCSFEKKNQKWSYQFLQTQTYPLPDTYVSMMKRYSELNGLELAYLNNTFGSISSEAVLNFKSKHSIDLIASHGQTIFHQPQNGLTFQIGSGAILSSTTHVPTVVDFRSQDVALGGQGAPLVPIGDLLLFSEYDACINIGGFANVSLDKNGKRIAWDICPANTVLNRYSMLLGAEYDAGGAMARKGTTQVSLLQQLHAIPYFNQEAPKSLGFEWVEEVLTPLFQQYTLSPEDVLSTYTQFVAEQIAHAVNQAHSKQILLTGGGAHNSYLIEQITQLTNANVVVPDQQTVDFKEALIFAFMGCLRFLGENNVIASVTGASRNHSAGCIYLP